MKIESFSSDLLNLAENIKNENHNILNPKKYNKTKIIDLDLFKELSPIMETENIDAVMFSSKIGAEEHTDIHLTHLDIYTYIVPVVLPEGKNILKHSEGEISLSVGDIVKINHQLPHSLSVENYTGCVLIMASKIL